MPDFLVSAPDLPTLNAVAAQIAGLWNADTQSISPQGAGPDGGGWVWAYFDKWYVPTGNTITDPNTGFAYPEMALKPGTYGLLRWNDALEKMPLPVGVTPVIDGDSITITAGPVTLTSPLPDDIPVRF